MKPQLRYFLLILTLLAGTAITAPALQAQESQRLQVILVVANNSGDGVEPSLRPYAGTLQRLFRFNSYRQVSRRGLKLDIPGESGVSLGDGQSLSLKAGERKGPGIVADLTWTRGNKRLLHTKVQLRPGRPAVLGGPRSDNNGGNYLLIVEME